MRKWLGKRQLHQTYTVKYGLRISHMDTWNDKLMALDRRSKKLLYVQKDEQRSSEEVVNLEQIRYCKIYKYTRGPKGTDQHKITRLALVFFRMDMSTENMLVIYDIQTEEPEDLPLCIKISKRWLHRVNRCVGFKLNASTL